MFDSDPPIQPLPRRQFSKAYTRWQQFHGALPTPWIGDQEVDLPDLHYYVLRTSEIPPARRWQEVATMMRFNQPSAVRRLAEIYQTHLAEFDRTYVQHVRSQAKDRYAPPSPTPPFPEPAMASPTSNPFAKSSGGLDHQGNPFAATSFSQPANLQPPSPASTHTSSMQYAPPPSSSMQYAPPPSHTSSIQYAPPPSHTLPLYHEPSLYPRNTGLETIFPQSAVEPAFPPPVHYKKTSSKGLANLRQAQAMAPMQPALTEQQKAERVIERLKRDFHAGLGALRPVPIPEDEITDYQEIVGQLHEMGKKLEPLLPQLYQLSKSEDATQASVYHVEMLRVLNAYASENPPRHIADADWVETASTIRQALQFLQSKGVTTEDKEHADEKRQHRHEKEHREEIRHHRHDKEHVEEIPHHRPEIPIQDKQPSATKPPDAHKAAEKTVQASPSEAVVETATRAPSRATADVRSILHEGSYKSKSHVTIVENKDDPSRQADDEWESEQPQKKRGFGKRVMGFIFSCLVAFICAIGK